jgi:hypothetical protein
MNWQQLQSLVTYWIKRPDIEAYYPQIQELAAERIGKDGRLLAMEVELPITFTSAFMDLPTDFASFKRVSANQAGRKYPLDVYTKQQLDLLTGGAAGGSPSGYAVYSDGIEIGPYSEEATIESTYYARPAFLVNSTDTNKVLTKWPSVYLYAMLTYAAQSLQDVQLENLYAEQYLTEIDQANQSDTFGQMSGNAPLMV